MSARFLDRLKEAWVPGRRGLVEARMVSDPIEQFRDWYEKTFHLGTLLPNAMILATAARDGRPSARVMLLKSFDADGFVFFSNYNSRKAAELDENPFASLVFYWELLRRQVRVEGRVERVDPKESDQYFQTRPRGARIGAWASPQSRVIAGRETLEQRVAEARSRFRDGKVPLPPTWGGYRLRPEVIEFWQGRLNRLHDRIRYTRRQHGNWKMERLAP